MNSLQHNPNHDDDGFIIDDEDIEDDEYSDQTEEDDDSDDSDYHEPRHLLVIGDHRPKQSCAIRVAPPPRGTRNDPRIDNRLKCVHPPSTSAVLPPPATRAAPPHPPAAPISLL
ncbi:hypothetical protein ACLB2K_030897 [Fragaria x ananassa]